MLYEKIKFLSPVIVIPLIIIGMAGCGQNSIFDSISHEVPPTNPIIRGTPSKIIKADIGDGEKLYLASGRIFTYAPSQADRSWERLDGPPGEYVVDVASTSGAGDDTLYILTIRNIDTKVWKKDASTDTGWKQVIIAGTDAETYGFIQNIFGADGQLFAGGAARVVDHYEYAILYENGGEFHLLEETEKAILSGAGVIGSDYYLATLGNFIRKVSFSSPTSPTVVPAEALPVLPATEVPLTAVPQAIAGLFQPEPNYIIAASRDGRILYGDSTGFTVPETTLGATFTGALALIPIPDPQDGNDFLLLIGVKAGYSSYRQGYQELLFNSITKTYSGDLRNPGETQPSSIADRQEYESTLRRYPVNSFWALPADTESPSVLFAATPLNGLYSYRDRAGNGIWQWNYED